MKRPWQFLGELHDEGDPVLAHVEVLLELELESCDSLVDEDDGICLLLDEVLDACRHTHL